MRAVLRTFCAFLVALVLGVGHVYAQAGATAQITGTVRDASGGVLPGVDVTATQTQTNFARSSVTDENGNFTLTNLPVGPYRLQAMLSGFRTFVQTGIVLTVNANPEIAVELGLGELTETVSVEAATPLVETRSPSLGAVVDNERIEELPLNGRNATDLIALIPAAVPQPGLNATSRSMQGYGQAFAVAGGQGFGVAYLLDGATHNNPYDNLNLPLPFPDALQEFRVETSTTNANAGMHSGASVNVVTKSGTNLFHGDLFEFFRDQRFNATNPFNLTDPTTGERQGDGLNRNQYGGTFSGPIVSDRIFFFGAFQGTRIRETPADLFAFVPTAAMLAGDFTTYASAACNSGTARTLGAPFVNNRLDPSQMSPAALNISRRLPTTNDPCGFVRYSRARPTDDTQYIGKVDVQMSQNHSLFGRYIYTTNKLTPPLALQEDNLLVSSLGGRDNKSHSLTAGDTLVLSNSMVNAFRVAYNYTDVHRTHEPLGFDAPDLGIKTFSYIEDYMLLAVNNGGFQLGGGTESEARFKTPSINFTDDLTVIKGDHQYGFGASVSFWTSLSQANVRSPGQFTFTGQNTGLPLADFLSGRLNTLIQATPNSLDMQQLYLGLYVQDTWKLSPKATLNYGLRWEPGLQQQIRNGAIYNFSVDRFLNNVKTTQYTNAPPGFLYPGDPDFVNDQAGIKDRWLQFSPRVGFAWDPTGDGRTSLRTGYSLAYDFVNAQFHLNTSVAPPFNAEARVTNPVGGFDDPWRGTGNETFFPFTTGPNSPFPLTGPYISISPDLAPPRQQSWNISFQRQIGDNLAASATYLGSYSDRMWNVRSLNQSVYIPGPCTLQTTTGPQFFANCSSTPAGAAANVDLRRKLTMADYEDGKYLGVTDEHTNLSYQKYNGLVLSLNRRAANGITAGVNYTLSKCTGLPTAGGGTPNVNSGYTDPNNPDFDLGPCDSDRRHNFNLSATAQTPSFDNKTTRYLLSDWRLSGVFRAYSGAPFSVTVATDPARTNIGGQRANLTGDPYGDTGSVTNYLNTASFVTPAVGTLGNSGRNAFNGPGQRFLDVSLVRSFRFASTHRLEARLESFNAFNWFQKAGPGFGPMQNPINNRDNVQFGRITAAGDPRIMQFALKYQF